MKENASVRIQLLARQGTSPYYTYQKLAAVYNDYGFKAAIVDTAEEVKDADIVITHNVYGFEKGTLNELAKKGVRVVSFLDNPMDKVAFLKSIDPGVLVVFSDPAHIPLVREITKGKNRIIDHPLDISVDMSKKAVPIKERAYDVLFAGRLVTFGNVNEHSFLERRLAKRIVEETLHSTEKLVHEIAADAFRPYKKLGLYKPDFADAHFLKYCWKLSHAVRRDKRIHVLNELKKVDKDLKIAFVSNDTAYLKKEFDARHAFFDFMPWSEVIDLMGQSKIVINTMPSRMDCLHERLVETMFNGAVCLSDTNRKINADFSDRKNILTFNYHASSLSNALVSVVRDDQLLQQVADAGHERIAELVKDDNWVSLVQKIMSA